MNQQPTSNHSRTAATLAVAALFVSTVVAPFVGCAYHATFCEAHPDHCESGGGLTATGAGAASATSSGSLATGSTSTGMACPASCDDMNPCTTDSCDQAGACTHTNVADNTALPDMTVGDCKKPVCIGGAPTSVSDDTDVPADVDPNDCKKPTCMSGMVVMVDNDTEMPTNGNTCQSGSCTNGTPQFANKMDGTPCGAGNAFMCLSGKCGCNMASDCGADTACGTWSCTASVCNEALVPAGRAPAQFQVPFDCQVVNCNGTSASPTTAYDPTDPTVGLNPCVNYVCSNAMSPPSTVQTNKGAGDACQGSDECDGSGNCCVPNGAACANAQCGIAIDNCNTQHSCGTCSGTTPVCLGQQCVQCVQPSDCASSTQGHICTSAHTCGCQQNGDCAGIPNAPACNPSTSTCVACVSDGDCNGSPHGTSCGAAAPNQCGCKGNANCVTATDGIDCGAAGANRCGCSVPGQCQSDNCNVATHICN